MPLKTNQPDLFMVLMTGIIDINHPSLKHRRQNIIVAHKHNDILMLIATIRFDLILLELTVNCSAASVSDRLRHFPWQSVASVPDRLRHSRHPWQSELITRIKDPLCINNKTPAIAIINPTEGAQKVKQCPMGFDDWLISPLSEERLNEIIDLWQTKALALIYIQIILRKTKNNQRLTLTIFEKLFEELPLQIVDIKDALENRQYDLAQEITHKLNGSVSFCGLTDIQQPASALESCLLNNNYASTQQLFITLQQNILNFTRHQESILANIGEC